MIAWLLAVGLAWAGPWQAERAPGVPEATQTVLATSDGAAVALTRYARAGAPVVLLCHGISSNHHFWDLAPDRSLAQWLYQQGYDVWSLDLRGHGDARRTSDGGRLTPGWTVDTYGMVDLPEALHHVRAQSGRDTVHFIGHSMGGMVLAVLLARQGADGLASATLVGSPLDFGDPEPVLGLMLGLAPGVMGAVKRIPTPMLGRSMGALGRAAPLQTDAFLHNPANVSRRAEKLMWRRVTSPITVGEGQQFGLMAHDGVFRSADGAIDYPAALADVALPALFVAGRGDNLVAPDRVYAYYQALGGHDKRFVVLSRANGAREDYGHLDLGVGDRVLDELFPLIGDFLAAHP